MKFAKIIILWTILLLMSLWSLKTNALESQIKIKNDSIILEQDEIAPFTGILVSEPHYDKLMQDSFDLDVYTKYQQIGLKEEVKCNECPQIAWIFGGGFFFSLFVMLLISAAQ